MKTKRCTKCGEIKPLSEFYLERLRADGSEMRRAQCKQCVINRSDQWRKTHPEQRKETALKFYRKRRLQALIHYGGNPPRCACCGEDKIEFLAIDHIDGNGARHRREIGRTRDLFQWLRKNSYPIGFQVLCHNCNFAKGAHGQCPHEAERNGTYEPVDIDSVLSPQKRTGHRMITYQGRTQSLQGWADEAGIHRSTISLRIDRYGWSIHDALTKPSKRKPK